MIGTSVAENIRKYRTEKGITQKQLAQMIGKSESHIADIENGKTSPTLKVIEDVADKLKIPEVDLFGFNRDEPDPLMEYMKLRIFNLEDRITVATILIKNGYTVRQTKQKKTESGKVLDYYIGAKLEDSNADTAR